MAPVILRGLLHVTTMQVAFEISDDANRPANESAAGDDPVGFSAASASSAAAVAAAGAELAASDELHQEVLTPVSAAARAAKEAARRGLKLELREFETSFVMGPKEYITWCVVVLQLVRQWKYLVAKLNSTSGIYFRLVFALSAMWMNVYVSRTGTMQSCCI